MNSDRSDRQPTAPRARRAVPETGSFGKSTRRSRSRTGSAPPKREDANMRVADELFSKFLAPGPRQDEDDNTTTSHKRKTSYLSQQCVSAQDVAAAAIIDSEAASSAQQQQQQQQQQFHHREPTEVILRGYASPDQQYAAVNHYEQVAGRICEDYAREPPVEARRYKSELRDPALARRQQQGGGLTAAERAKVARVAGGAHWIKVTFESADAADAAVYASPQRVLGHLVHAEPYRGLPPKEDVAIVADIIGGAGGDLDPAGRSNGLRGGFRRRPSQSRNGGVGGRRGIQANQPQHHHDLSPQGSQTSTQTMDSATMSSMSGTASTATVTGFHQPGNSSSATLIGGAGKTAPNQNNNSNNNTDGGNNNNENDVYCSVIPTARKVRLLPADQAVAPQPSPLQVLLAQIPLVGWFSGSMIGSEVPRNEVGEFDLTRASLFWRLMFYLDLWFGLFGSDLVSGDKED